MGLPTLAFSLKFGLAEAETCSGGTEFLLLVFNSGFRGGTLLFLDFSVSFFFPLPLSLLRARSGDQLEVLFIFFFILFWFSVWASSVRGSSVRNLTCFFALFSVSLEVTTMLGGSCWLLGVQSLPPVCHNKHNVVPQYSHTHTTANQHNNISKCSSDLISAYPLYILDLIKSTWWDLPQCDFVAH